MYIRSTGLDNFVLAPRPARIRHRISTGVRTCKTPIAQPWSSALPEAWGTQRRPRCCVAAGGYEHCTAIRRRWVAAASTLPVQWIKGDAMIAGDVIDARTGGPRSSSMPPIHPNYRNWRGLALPMLDNTIAAAKAHNARIVLPATVYNFGKDSAQRLQENSPQVPTTRKGQVRVEMELRLQKARPLRRSFNRACAPATFSAPAPQIAG